MIINKLTVGKQVYSGKAMTQMHPQRVAMLINRGNEYNGFCPNRVVTAKQSTIENLNKLREKLPILSFEQIKTRFSKHKFLDKPAVERGNLQTIIKAMQE